MSVNPISEAAAPRWDARLWGTLTVLCGALFLDGLDLSMVGVALPSIQSDLGLSTSALQWVVSGYVLGYGGLLLLGGRAADLLGRRRVFLAAIAVFAVASLLGGLAVGGVLLIVTRFVKGVSAAFTAPAGLSIITTTFAEGPSRNRALAFYTTCAASGFSLGLVIGGLLTEASWRFTFLLPAPIALAVFIAGLALIPRDTTATAGHRAYDLGGALTVTAAMLLLVYAVVVAPEVGWGSAQTIGSFVAVAALLVAFVLIEQRSAQPLVRLSILRSGALVRANLGAMAAFGGYASFQFIGTLYLQAHLGWTPLQTALAFLPTGLVIAFGAPRTGGLVGRYGTPRILVVGFVAFAVGYALFLRIQEAPDYWTVILPTMLFIGVGFALAFPALNIQAVAGVRDADQGLAAGLFNTSFELGGAVILAIVTAVIAGSGSSAGSIASSQSGMTVVVGTAVAGLVVALSGLRWRHARRSRVVATAALTPVPNCP